MRALVFSIAHNGYGLLYRPCLRAQARYAAEHGYAHVVVERPVRVTDPALSAWLKVPLLLEALRGAYDVAMFVDADCAIRRSAPPLDGFVADGEPVNMALGRSGRFNSGVIVARRSVEAERFLGGVLDSVTEEIPPEDRARLKFENGNLIYCARTLGGVGTLDWRWNNTDPARADDHVRHFTGPMRATYVPRPAARLAQRAVAATVRTPAAQPVMRTRAFRDAVEALARRSIARYPALGDAARR
jgi:hypothetical protein